MLFLIALGLALVGALVWQLAAKRDSETMFFVPRFIVAFFGVLFLGLLLFGVYFVIVARNLGGL